MIDDILYENRIIAEDGMPEVKYRMPEIIIGWMITERSAIIERDFLSWIKQLQTSSAPYNLVRVFDLKFLTASSPRLLLL